MKTIAVNASKKYDVIIGVEFLASCGKRVKQVKNPCKTVIVSDDMVFPLYGHYVKSSLEEEGFSTHEFIFPNGEQSKTMATVIKLVEYFAEVQLCRSDLVVALGGGVVGDLCGFAAAIYLRGIDFIQIPTTLLAAIDSSVGGKTGASLPNGKNQVGAFHQPILVLCDIGTFKTLSLEIFGDGICEALKYAVICDPYLFMQIGTGDINSMIEEIVARCICIKRDIVLRDEFDKGERMLLNLGHTVGHAIESLSEYKITHGNAVGIGMAVIARACEKSGVATECCSDKIVKVLGKYDISTECTFGVHDLCKKIMADKKRDADSISLVLVEKIGKAFIHKIKLDELVDFIKLGLEK